MEIPVHESEGVLKYSHDPDYGHKLVVEADPELARLVRSLIPKSYGVRPPRYRAHVTVIRKEVPTVLEPWCRHEGRIITFKYEMWARNDERYWWVRVFSDDLADIRGELGLQPYGRTTMALDLKRCYHLTVGNTK